MRKDRTKTAAINELARERAVLGKLLAEGSDIDPLGTIGVLSRGGEVNTAGDPPQTLIVFLRLAENLVAIGGSDPAVLFFLNFQPSKRIVFVDAFGEVFSGLRVGII